MSLPSLIAHADWSTQPSKRWYAVATRDGHGYELHSPRQAGDLTTFLPRLRASAGQRSVLLGFDFPIGLPAAYAQLAGITRFTDALRKFGFDAWSPFYEIASEPSEISLCRPFYPARCRGPRHAHLVERLSLSWDALLRRCERRTERRPAACPLFWTLGGKQVGPAAISGWRDVIRPSLEHSTFPIRMWPFDGALQDLLSDGAFVIAETYPADAFIQLGLVRPFQWSKRRQADRQLVAAGLKEAAKSAGSTLHPALAQAIDDGFGAARSGEDAFDATLGLLAMVRVALGVTGAGAPTDPVIRDVEGWILGQPARFVGARERDGQFTSAS